MQGLHVESAGHVMVACCRSVHVVGSAAEWRRCGLHAASAERRLSPGGEHGCRGSPCTPLRVARGLGGRAWVPGRALCPLLTCRNRIFLGLCADINRRIFHGLKTLGLHPAPTCRRATVMG